MIFYLQWNTKGEFLMNILDVLLNIMKVNEDWCCQAYKIQKLHLKNSKQ